MRKLYSIIALSFIFTASEAQLVYKDVAGIFHKRCSPCHNPLGGAPFSVLTYTETASWSAMIQYDLTNNIMPPWSPDTTYTRFVHERIITAPEKNAILSWINSGSQAGDTTQAPPPPVYTSQYKLKGTPDLILKIPAFASNASTNDTYNCFALPTGLTQDRYIRAFEVVPNNPSLVHHAVIKVDSMGATSSNTSGNCFSQPGDYDLEVYALGGAPTVFPGTSLLKCGVRVKAGAKLNFQMHYPAGTAGQIDSTEIRIYFYPAGTTGIRPVNISTPLQNWNLIIPANTTPSFSAQYPSSGGLPVPISVLATFPHGHLVSKTMLNYADNGSNTVPLIRINDWDFEWQGFYTFRKLVKLPAGYTLRATHTYDNTVNNPNNPNSPPALITAGEDTKDEMLFDSFQWLYYLPGDEFINIDSLLKGDSLLNPPLAVNEPIQQSASSFFYPNPFLESTVLWSDGFDWNSSSAELRLYDVMGNLVYSQSIHSAQETIKPVLNSGLYFYSLSDDHRSTGGKLVVLPR